MDNPVVIQIISILNQMKSWLLAIIGIVTVVVVIISVIKYQTGDESEKAGEARKIRNTIIMGAGVFALVWFATWVINQMAGI